MPIQGPHCLKFCITHLHRTAEDWKWALLSFVVIIRTAPKCSIKIPKWEIKKVPCYFPFPTCLFTIGCRHITTAIYIVTVLWHLVKHTQKQTLIEVEISISDECIKRALLLNIPKKFYFGSKQNLWVRKVDLAHIEGEASKFLWLL